MATPGGQRLFVSTLLPRDAAVAVQPASILTCGGQPAGAESAAVDDPVRTFLSVEAPGGPASTRFLHVLEGADGGASPSAVTLLESSAGTPHAGAAVRGTAVLFPVDLGGTFAGVTYAVPPGVSSHKVTGLPPGASFGIASVPAAGGGTTVTVSPGGGQVADSGGVLSFSTGAAGPRIDSVTPARGPLAGGTAVTIRGAGFLAGATVSFGGSPAAGTTVAGATEIRATSPPAAGAGPVAVTVRNPDGTSTTLSGGFTYEAASAATSLLVPIVLALEGLGGSAYSTELTFTNKGASEALLTLHYTAAFGSGSGTASVSVAAGRQLRVPDSIRWLASLGVPVPGSGPRGGALRVEAAGLADPSELGIVARTTTAVPEGRAGLAYAAVPEADLVTDGAVLLAGLQQGSADRTNLAVVHAGPAGSGDVTLRVTVVSGDPARPGSAPPLETTLAPGGFFQWTEILAAAGGAFPNAWARVERVRGTAPFSAYAVVNDQGTSDGSFVPPAPLAAALSATRLVVPAVVSAGTFTTELVATNVATSERTVRFSFRADGISTADRTARFERRLAPGEQWVRADVVAWLREQGVAGIGDGPLSGALVAETVGGGGVLVGARTSAAGGAGKYGVFTPGLPATSLATTSATLDLLLQDAGNRTNLAIVDAGPAGGPDGSYTVDLFDGATGQLAGSVGPVTVPAGGWRQVGTILATGAPGTEAAWARVRRTSGPGPFLAYTVVNDGAAPGERSGDGAYVPMGGPR